MARTTVCSLVKVVDRSADIDDTVMYAPRTLAS
jgi:hypothetical protein